MAPEHQITFGPFRLETTPGRLWRGDQVIPLRPRSLAMLRYLVAHPGRLVTKAEVQQQVWAGTHVTDSVLRVCVREIRAALGAAATAPRDLEAGAVRRARWGGRTVPTRRGSIGAAGPWARAGRGPRRGAAGCADAGGAVDAADDRRGMSVAAVAAETQAPMEDVEAVGAKQAYASPPGTQKLNLILHGFG